MNAVRYNRARPKSLRDAKAANPSEQGFLDAKLSLSRQSCRLHEPRVKQQLQIKH